MPAVPSDAGPLGAWLEPFAAALGQPTWRRVLVLVTSALLAPGRRTLPRRRSGSDGRRGHVVDYRHVPHALRAKPGALVGLSAQPADALAPGQHRWLVWAPHAPARHRHRHRALASPRHAGADPPGSGAVRRTVRDPSGEKEPQAFLCTDLAADPVDILRWFVRRWRTETTFEEARRHLGVETPRQWSDLAILRTTPTLLALFSLVTLWAEQLAAERGPVVECVRWYRKLLPTFSDALALVRHELWTAQLFATSPTTSTAQNALADLIGRLLLVTCRPP